MRLLEEIKPGEMRWARWPNGSGVGSAFFHPETARKLVERGWMMIDGIRAEVSYECPDWYDSPITGRQPPCPHTLHLEFEQGYGHWREHP